MNSHLITQDANLNHSMSRFLESDGLYLIRLAYATRNTLNPRTTLQIRVRWGVEYNGRLLEWFDRRKDAKRLITQIERIGHS